MVTCKYKNTEQKAWLNIRLHRGLNLLWIILLSIFFNFQCLICRKVIQLCIIAFQTPCLGIFLVWKWSSKITRDDLLNLLHIRKERNEFFRACWRSIFT